ncbi:MAG: response regulator [Gallionella sp.]|nr:response regulator [Gallionella sp.]
MPPWTCWPAATSHQPDALDESGYIVLLDAMMPGMDSIEVPRQLKLMPQTAHIPIIFMTGLTETEHLVAALEAGGVDYVNKPLKPKEVLARMQVHLQGARRAVRLMLLVTPASHQGERRAPDVADFAGA